jgi:ABC-type dipeptide/oligopeptide/nickel transport system permease component
LGTYVVRRLIISLFVILGTASFLFIILNLTGDPVLLLVPEDASPEQIEAVRRNLGLDRPLIFQYLAFLKRLVTGNLGDSWRRKRPVVEILPYYILNTIKLTMPALVITTFLSLAMGTLAAVKRNSFADLTATLIATAGNSMPIFWSGILLIMVFGVKLRWLPISGTSSWQNYVMPVVAIGFFMAAGLARTTRTSMLEVLNIDYIRTARSKGLTERRVILKHALKNAALPIITVWGTMLGTLLRGTVVTETVFSWPGIGRLSVEAVLGRDYPLTVGIVLFFAVVFIGINLLVDLAYALLDPRVRYE